MTDTTDEIRQVMREELERQEGFLRAMIQEELEIDRDAYALGEKDLRDTKHMYLIIRTQVGKSYEILRNQLRSLPGEAHLTGDNHLYRVTLDEDTVQQIVAQRLELLAGVEVVAINAPYDEDTSLPFLLSSHE